MEDLIKAAEDNFANAVAIKRFVGLDKFIDSYEVLPQTKKNLIDKAIKNNDLKPIHLMIEETTIIKHMGILDLFKIASSLGIKNSQRMPKEELVKQIETRRGS